MVNCCSHSLSFPSILFYVKINATQIKTITLLWTKNN